MTHGATKSRIDGMLAGRDLHPFDVVVDLVDVYDGDDLVWTEKVTRVVRERIPAGCRIELRSGGLWPATA